MADGTMRGGVRRIMGIETEYGISVPGAPMANAMTASAAVVRAYAALPGVTTARPRWDYADESPLDDARGFTRDREQAHPSQLTDTEDPGVPNLVLTNGARLYVDHAHPEYSSPEVLTPREGIVWDRAGEVVMARAVDRLAAAPPGINLYKNNTDGKGASYGTHENFLLDRAVEFSDVVAALVPFLVTRQVLCGTGRVGIGQRSDRPGFQLGQRSDFMESVVALETTFNRPIVNTRDEPHADPDRYRRLHVIIGDATHADTATLLALGTTSLVLSMLEHGTLGEPLRLADPVAAVRAVSHDPSLTATVTLEDGRRLTALDVQEDYLARVRRHLGTVAGGEVDTETAEVVGTWERVLAGLRGDRESVASDVEWLAKLTLLQAYRDRDGMAWDDPRLAAIDIQWSDVRPDRGIAHRLRRRGALRCLATPEEIADAVTLPPGSTRAWLRGELVRRFPGDVVTASWDSVTVGRGTGDARQLRRVALPEPAACGRADMEAALDDADDALDAVGGMVS